MQQSAMLTTRERVMRMIVAGTIACSMGTACLAPATAQADEGSITIHQRANDGAAYVMYQVFVADIDDDNMATHVAWTEANKDAVLAFLDLPAQTTGASVSYAEWLGSQGLTGEGDHDNAQNAAGYISAMIAESANAMPAGEPATKSAGSFAESLAQHLAANGVRANPGTAESGVPYVNDEGYYLAVSAPSTIGADEAGTAPLWIPLGGSMREIDAKEASPTLSLQVMDDRAGSVWDSAADSNIGQDLAYRVQGTLPANINAYDSYHDRYTIALPAGMALAGGTASSVSVALDGEDVTGQVQVAYENGVLTVEATDLKSLVQAGGEGAIIGPLYDGSGLEIRYSAHLDAGAVIGEGGNATTVERAYTADPVGLSESTSTRQAVFTYAYGASLLKIDKSNKQALGCARFTLQASNGGAANKDGTPSAVAPDANTDEGSAGMYVQGDGTLGSAPYEFESDANGELLVSGIDEGVYIVHETAAPPGYELQDTDIVLTVASELDQRDGGLAALTARVSGGEAADVDGDEAARLLSVDKARGIVRMQAVDDHMLELAGTGLPGNGMLYVLAGVLAGAGTTGLASVGRKHGRRK